MKLYQVSTEKPIDFEVKGHLEVKFLKSSFYLQLTWKFNRMKIDYFSEKNDDFGSLTLSLPLTSKIVGFPIQWSDMQILFKFQVNWMKNDDFTNLTSRWPFDFKIKRLLSCDNLYNLVKFHDDRFRIATCMRKIDRQTDRQAGRRPLVAEHQMTFDPWSELI